VNPIGNTQFPNYFLFLQCNNLDFQTVEKTVMTNMTQVTRHMFSNLTGEIQICTVPTPFLLDTYMEYRKKYRKNLKKTII
jgi:hypothetical protein